VQEGDPEQIPGDPHAEDRTGFHPRAAAIRPANWYNGDPQALPTREIDQFDVKHDARNALSPEHVCCGQSAKALEPALRVLNRPDDPNRGQGVERLSQHSAIPGLSLPHIRAIGLDATPECHIVFMQGFDDQGDHVGWSRHIGVGKDHVVAGRGEDSCSDSRALSSVRNNQDRKFRLGTVTAPTGLGTGSNDLGSPIGASIIDDEDMDVVR
jgi:hypothetical protein